jgi:hypothetical protein
MKIYCLFAQQKCSYKDEYAPDLRAAIDEWGNSDNPDYLNEEEDKLRKDGSIAFWRRITIDVDDAQFDRLFYPPSEMLKPTNLSRTSEGDLDA